jgi:hypothetical protein
MGNVPWEGNSDRLGRWVCPYRWKRAGKKREIGLDGGGLGFTNVTGYREGKVGVFFFERKPTPTHWIGF